MTNAGSVRARLHHAFQAHRSLHTSAVSLHQSLWAQCTMQKKKRRGHPTALCASMHSAHMTLALAVQHQHQLTQHDRTKAPTYS
jgi:hypothetical protein